MSTEAMDEQQELWYEAVYRDPEMSDTQKAAALYTTAKEYWRRLVAGEARYAARDAEATAWAEQATRSAGEIARLQEQIEQRDSLLLWQGKAHERLRGVLVDAAKGIAESEDGELYPLYLRLEAALGWRAALAGTPHEEGEA